MREAILSHAVGDELICRVRIPSSNLHCLSQYHRTDAVLEQDFENDMCLATLRLTQEELNRLVAKEGAVQVDSEGQIIE